MAKNKYLGEDAVTELYGIMLENFLTREEVEEREKSLTNSVQVGCAFIAGSILQLAKVMDTAQGGAGGVNERYVATDYEVDEVLKQYFGDAVDTVEVEPIFEDAIDDDLIATDDEVDEVLKQYFN